MGAVLTTGSTLVCPHGGRVSLSSRQSKLNVAGHAVLQQADLAGASISGCTTPQSTNPPTKPCTTIVSVLSGLAAKLTVNGAPVLLDSATGLTDGFLGSPVTWNVQTAGQQKATSS